MLHALIISYILYWGGMGETGERRIGGLTKSLAHRLNFTAAHLQPFSHKRERLNCFMHWKCHIFCKREAKEMEGVNSFCNSSGWSSDLKPLPPPPFSWTFSSAGVRFPPRREGKKKQITRCIDLKGLGLCYQRFFFHDYYYFISIKSQKKGSTPAINLIC